MSKTTKIVLGGVAALALAYTAASWYVGTKAEQEIHGQVDKINAAIATHFSVNLVEDTVNLKVVNYQRGVFSSAVSYELMIHEEGGESYQLLLEDHLRHGPLPVAALMQGHLSPVLAYSQLKLLPSQNIQPWFDATQNKPPIIANTFVSFDGSTHSKIDLAAVNYQDESGDTLLTEAATATVLYQAGKEHLSIDGTLPSFNLTEQDGGQLQIKTLRVYGDLTGLSEGQKSNGTLEIEHIDFALEDEVQIRIDGTRAQSSYELNNGLLDSALRYELDSIRVADQDIGQMQLDLAAKRLDYDMVTLLSQSEDIDNMTAADFQPLMEQFFSHKPELKINSFTWKNPAGVSQLSAAMEMAPTAANEYMKNELDLAHFFNLLDIDLVLSREMLGGFFAKDDFAANLADMMFSQMAKQGKEAGLLVYDGNNAEFALHFDAANNTLMLNGEPASQDQLLYAWMLLKMGGDIF